MAVWLASGVEVVVLAVEVVAVEVVVEVRCSKEAKAYQRHHFCNPPTFVCRFRFRRGLGS